MDERLNTMKKDCANCDHLGRDCPKTLMLLPLDEIIAWCQRVMLKNKITHEKAAQLSRVPKGTIDRVMSKQSEDCRYSTIHAIVCALFEFLGISSVCLDDVVAETAAQSDDMKRQNAELQHALADAEKERQALRERIADLAENRAHMKEQIAKQDDTIKDQRRTIKLLASLLGGAVLLIIGALIVDKLDPSVGFFWRGA